jgi:MYXO-CTERM domain-containing protein
VCGRSCATDLDCGAGFHCKPTTTSGDLQCVSDTGCRNGASPCTTDAECTASTCLAGACLGPTDVADAGARDAASDASDAGADAGAPFSPGGGGCSCRIGAPQSAPGAALTLTSLCAAVALAHRRRRQRSEAP